MNSKVVPPVSPPLFSAHRTTAAPAVQSHLSVSSLDKEAIAYSKNVTHIYS